MERMWTPWRLDYILSDKQAGCVFCNMLEAEDDRAMLILERDERAFLVLNKYPYNNGHLMAVPYHHAELAGETDVPRCERDDGDGRAGHPGSPAHDAS